jgi:hypothetical protein
MYKNICVCVCVCVYIKVTLQKKIIGIFIDAKARTSCRSLFIAYPTVILANLGPMERERERVCVCVYKINQ